MTDVTLHDHLARAAAVARVLRNHGADIADLAADAPKLIAIASDLHAAFKKVDVQESVAAARATAPQAPAPEPKITATQAAVHVEKHGLTPEQRIAFDRAGGLGTG